MKREELVKRNNEGISIINNGTPLNGILIYDVKTDSFHVAKLKSPSTGKPVEGLVSLSKEMIQAVQDIDSNLELIRK